MPSTSPTPTNEQTIQKVNESNKSFSTNLQSLQHLVDSTITEKGKRSQATYHLLNAAKAHNNAHSIALDLLATEYGQQSQPATSTAGCTPPCIGPPETSNNIVVRFAHPPKLGAPDAPKFSVWRRMMEDKLKYDGFATDEEKQAYIFSRIEGTQQDRVLQWLRRNEDLEYDEKHHARNTHRSLLNWLEKTYANLY